MLLKHTIGALFFVAVGCAHGPQGSASQPIPDKTSAPMKDLRLAQANLVPQAELGPQGVVNFEQMPNSMIVTFRVEGLKPKSTYNVTVYEGQDCDSLDLSAADNISRIRTDKLGIAEGSFRSEQRTLAGQRGVVGDAIAIREFIEGAVRQNSPEITCGTIEPRASSASL